MNYSHTAAIYLLTGLYFDVNFCVVEIENRQYIFPAQSELADFFREHRHQRISVWSKMTFMLETDINVSSCMSTSTSPRHHFPSVSTSVKTAKTNIGKLKIPSLT